MKQVTPNSKLGLSISMAVFVPAGGNHNGTPQATAGTAHCPGAEGAETLLCPSFRKWLSCVLRVTLIGALVISGCTSKDSEEYSGQQGKQIQKEQGSATTGPVHKEVGEASWYRPGTSRPGDRQWRDL